MAGQTRDISDQSAVEERKKALELRALQTKRVIAEIMENPHGRNFMWDLLEQTHMLSTSFSSDAMTMAFREGERNFGLQLWARIQEASPARLTTMLAEKGQASG